MPRSEMSDGITGLVDAQTGPTPPYLTYLNFRKEPSPSARWKDGKVTRLFYSPFDGAKPFITVRYRTQGTL
jgi:hypothetical protein